MTATIDNATLGQIKKAIAKSNEKLIAAVLDQLLKDVLKAELVTDEDEFKQIVEKLKTSFTTKAKNDSTKKKGLSGYQMWSNHMRAAVAEEVKESTISKKELEERWSALSDDEKEEWEEKAKGGKKTAFQLWAKEESPNVMTVLGARWKEVSDEEKEEWKQKAEKHNAEQKKAEPESDDDSASTSTTTTTTKTKTKTTPKRKPVLNDDDNDDDDEGVPISRAWISATIAGAAEEDVVFDETLKKWVIKGTKFVVKSENDHRVCGKGRSDKVIKLSDKDKEKCHEKGYKLENDDGDDDSDE